MVLIRFSVACSRQECLSGLSSVPTTPSLCGCWTELPSGAELQPACQCCWLACWGACWSSLLPWSLSVTVIIFSSSTSFAISFSGRESLPFRASAKPHSQSYLHKHNYSAFIWASVPFAFLAVTVWLLFSSHSSFADMFCPLTYLYAISFPWKLPAAALPAVQSHR